MSERAKRTLKLLLKQTSERSTPSSEVPDIIPRVYLSVSFLPSRDFMFQTLNFSLSLLTLSMLAAT